MPDLADGGRDLVMMNTAIADFTCFRTQRLPFLSRTVRVTYRSISAT